MHFERFPAATAAAGDGEGNLAISLFGNRFHGDQSVVEYLAEFLLVLASDKKAGGDRHDAFFPAGELAGYFPEHGLSLKLIAFFKTSKQEARHASHKRAYLDGLERLRERLDASTSPTEADDFLHGIQGLLGGFVGVAANRAWNAQAFLPASKALLAREVMWSHTGARKNHPTTTDWAQTKKHFQVNKHNFFARGGEHLYLQLAQLLRRMDDDVLVEFRNRQGYEHLLANAATLRSDLERGLADLLSDEGDDLGRLAKLVTDAVQGCDADKLPVPPSVADMATFGWVPSTCLPEAQLFAWELDNLLAAAMDPLQRIEALQLLAVLHVMRTLCFQAMRCTPASAETLAFAGQYVWVAAPPGRGGGELRHLAERSYQALEKRMTLTLRAGTFPLGPITKKGPPKTPQESWRTAELLGPKLMRKLGKAVGMVVPYTGDGMRFRLTDEAIRMLVPALLPPGARLSAEAFERRLYHHFGLVLGGDMATKAAAWATPDATPKADWPRATWFADALAAGGFLIPLSDAVSMVQNPHPPTLTRRSKAD